MSINVTVVGATGVSASITNTDIVNVAAGTAFQAQVPQLRVEAGANITITTTSGSFTVIGRDVPVQSVQGRAGAVVLTRADLTAAAAVHSHAASDITSLTSVANVVSVAGRTGVVTIGAADVSGLAPVATSGSYTSLTSIPTAFTPATHTHSQSQITNLVFPVTQVQGRTGSVTLTITDLTAASSTHAHAYVQSLNGLTGTPSIVAGSNVTVTTSAGSITVAAGGGGGNVLSVNGRTGSVTLTFTDVSAASAVHTHVASDIANLTSVANVVSVNGRTGAVSIAASDVTAASSTHAHAYVQSLNGQTGSVSIVAGSNVNVTTAVGSITIDSATAQSLIIGTITSGTAAAASITGSPPSLNLTLQAGPPGSAGSFSDAQSINERTSSYTLVLSDAGTLVAMGATSGALVVTIPAAASVAFPTGTHVDLARLGAATVSVIGATGVTVNATPGSNLRAQYSAATAIRYAGDTWLVVGDLS